MVKDTKWHVAWIQLSWRKMLHSACSRGKSSLRAELQFSRVIYPNSHVLLSHRPWWWRKSYSDPLLQDNLYAEPNFTSVPGSAAWRLLCCTEKAAMFCLRTGMASCGPVTAIFPSGSRKLTSVSTGMSGAQHRDGMAWDGMRSIHGVPTSIGCRQFSKETPEISF